MMSEHNVCFYTSIFPYQRKSVSYKILEIKKNDQEIVKAVIM